MRDEFSERVKRIVAERVNFRCSYCYASTSGPQVAADASLNVGVAAHITAASPTGPRYDASLTQEERSGPENAIWLDQTHAKLIDNDVIRFSVADLRQWKHAAEQRAWSAIGRPVNDGERSKSKLRLCYHFGANLSKLCWASILDSVSHDEQEMLKTLVREAERVLGLSDVMINKIEHLINAPVSLGAMNKLAPELRNTVTMSLNQSVGPEESTAFYLGFNLISAVVIFDVASISNPTAVTFVPPLRSTLAEICRDADRLRLNIDGVRAISDALQGSETHDYSELRSTLLSIGSSWELGF